MTTGACDFCLLEGKSITENLFMCDKCKSILKDPKWAQRLFRGHLGMKLRGTMQEKALGEFLEVGIKTIINNVKPGL